jgi:hypothetical protein
MSVDLSRDARRPDPRRYFEAIGDARTPIATQEPVCLYLETTNRCNLLCETCPRTFEELEPPADMSWELFTRIVREGYQPGVPEFMSGQVKSNDVGLLQTFTRAFQLG